MFVCVQVQLPDVCALPVGAPHPVWHPAVFGLLPGYHDHHALPCSGGPHCDLQGCLQWVSGEGPLCVKWELHLMSAHRSGDHAIGLQGCLRE